VLVAGITPAGTALTLLLRAAGYDPVLVGDSDRSAPSRLAYLSPAALAVLGTLDLGGRLHEHGRTVAGVTVQQATGAGDTDPTTVTATEPPGSGRVSPTIVPTAAVTGTLYDALPRDAITLDRTVDSVTRRDGGLVVAFDDGVRESFDVVVDAGTPNAPLRSGDANEPELLYQYEASADGVPDDGLLRDVWTSEAVVQRFHGITGGVVRITTPADGDFEPPRPLSGVPDVPDGSFTRRRVRQRRLPDGAVPDRWWGAGRIAYCGSGACPVAPATGLAPSLGISDALGLASALTRDVCVRRAVETYAAARARRFDLLRRAVTRGSYPVAAAFPAPPSFESLRTLRAVALDPVFGTAPGPLDAGGSG
jgi:2-polyprenyl-6-methoxyphenol hydroxylase-like FAD-dependent oxidoreductase